MHRTLIVARMDAGDAEAVAKIFADSDSTDLPRMIGVTRRTLFRFHDLYFHLVEADQDIADPLYKARGSELYKDINTRLGEHISPYDPGWKEPKDAMAVPFYAWTPAEGPQIQVDGGDK
ncbi:TcmI family type II polyketide cyclase [Saccharopolyspora indica]|uniref:TcmI family type II polyketide cyclase n=1 Tax=Saccharopolyspora indica TaxID=1229659 RepID=UPI0022EAD69E|nr:TcmI family type II polyketide cyclase [Saccharopolyspora indica]MDA3647664.1 TcmI family type II polyketide cyclase [Saccharopolyspora indica]